MNRNLVRILGSGLCVGYIRFVPGTFGTLWGVLLAVLLPSGPWLAFCLAAVFVLGLPLARLAERADSLHDPKWFIVDEIAGSLLTVCWVPLLSGRDSLSWQVILAGFVAFRIFDWTKPWPIRRIEEIPEGWGVMLDDLMAAIYAGVVVLVAMPWLD